MSTTNNPTPVDLAELERVATAAPVKQWNRMAIELREDLANRRYEPVAGTYLIVDPEQFWVLAVVENNDGNGETTSAFIEAFPPQTALELIAQVRRWQGFAERLMASKDHVEAELGYHGEEGGARSQIEQLRSALGALVDVDDDKFINEGGTCVYCGKDALEDADTDELDEDEIDELPKHEEDCPVMLARALLEQEA